MKTKTLINLTIFALLPLFLSGLMVSCIGIEWVLLGNGKLAETFLTGKFNKPFVMILFSSGVISISIIFTTLLMLMKYADKIDNLDEAISKALEAKYKYEAATMKIVRDIK